MWGAAAQALAGFAFPRGTPGRSLARNAAEPVPRHPARLLDRAACTRRPRRRYAGIMREAERVARSAARRSLAARTESRTRLHRLQFAQLGARRAGAAAEGLEGGRRRVGRRAAGPAPRRDDLTPRSKVPVLRMDHDPSALETGPARPFGPGAARRPVAAGGYLLENERPAPPLQRPGRDHQHLRQGSPTRARRGPCNCLRMYKDVPAEFDAWDIDSSYSLMPVNLDAPATIEVVAAGPLVGRTSGSSGA